METFKKFAQDSERFAQLFFLQSDCRIYNQIVDFFEPTIVEIYNEIVEKKRSGFDSISEMLRMFMDTLSSLPIILLFGKNIDRL